MNSRVLFVWITNYFSDPCLTKAFQQQIFMCVFKPNFNKMVDVWVLKERNSVATCILKLLKRKTRMLLYDTVAIFFLCRADYFTAYALRSLCCFRLISWERNSGYLWKIPVENLSWASYSGRDTHWMEMFSAKPCFRFWNRFNRTLSAG